MTQEKNFATNIFTEVNKKPYLAELKYVNRSESFTFMSIWLKVYLAAQTKNEKVENDKVVHQERKIHFNLCRR